jgi:sarcosine oxidase subunit gamma
MAELQLNYHRAAAGRILPAQPDVFEIEEIDGLARYSLRGAEAVIGSISKALDVSLDQPINRAVSAGGCSALHLGPDEWLLLLEQTQAKDIGVRIRDAAGDRAYALVDVSHRNVGLRLRGTAVVDALASGCPQNLEIDAFPIGKCTRTVYAKAGIFLWRRDEHEFMLETWRSFVPYLLDYLAQETVLL